MNNPLHKKFKAFSITELRPEGWLKNQLRIQMDGSTGMLHDVWDSVGSYSGWLGGTGENWERAPYYLDGLVPLSYYLEDSKRWEICLRFVEWTLNSQDHEGNFGPDASKTDYWSRYVMLKVLVQYCEITGDDRVIPFCINYFRFVEKSITIRPVTQWSKARVGDLLYCAAWVYERRPDAVIPRIVQLHREQALDWDDLFSEFPFTRPTAYYYNWEKVHENNASGKYDEAMAYHATHIVNVTMGLKYPAMLYCFDHEHAHHHNVKNGIAALRKYHGVASGAINGDEHLSGNSPSQGAELCSIVEYMFSLQCLLEVFGDPDFADYLERIAYNALPATITEDYMSHQYLQQANQVLVSRAKRNWFNNDETANLYGLEPHYGCCTANMHQGWPKYLKSLWFRKGNDAVVSMTFAPSSLNTCIEGKQFGVLLETDYPFHDILRYRITNAEQVQCSIYVRIPDWCRKPHIEVDKSRFSVAEQDGFLKITGSWRTDDGFTVTFPMETVYYSRWCNDSIAVERGPLVFALDMQETWKVIGETAGMKDYEVSSLTSWNYAIYKGGAARIRQHGVGAIPFSKKDAPVSIHISGKKLKNWGLRDNSAAPVPHSPVQSTEPDEDLRLIPFGCTKLRISQFPYVKV